MTKRTDDDSALEKTSWRGHRLAQHRAFYALSLEEKLRAVEEMADFAREMSKLPSPKRTTAAAKKEVQEKERFTGFDLRP